MTPLTLPYAGPTTEEIACIPDALKKRDQWVLWLWADRVNTETGEATLTKIPIDPHTLNHASTTDQETWGTFARCVAALPVALEQWEQDALSGYQGGGLGYVFTADDPYAGIDLDHCRNPHTGAIAAWAQPWIDALNSYTQVSVSGTGLHSIVEATLPPERRQSGDYQMWDHSRFFAMTGWHLPGTPMTIQPRHTELTALWLGLFGPKVGQAVLRTNAKGEIQEPTPWIITAIQPHTTGELYAFFAEAPGGWPLALCEVAQQDRPGAGTAILTDDEILVKARAAKNSAKFQTLWEGDTHGYASPSEADLALCCLLAFWTRDPAQIQRLFEQSALCRDKWTKRPDYCQRTLTAALTFQAEHYTPAHGTQLLVTTAAQQAQHGQNGHTAAPSQPVPPAWHKELLRNKSGTPQQTINNFVLAIQHLAPWESAGCWYDLVRERHMVGAKPVEDGDATTAGVVIEQATAIRVTNIALVGRALDYVCRQHGRDLLREWIDTLPQVPVSALLMTRLRTYGHVPDVVSDAYVADVSRIIPVGIIARILDPGCQHRFVPIFEGPENAGKSKLTKALAGHDPYGQSWHVALSAGMEGKEAHMMLDGALIAELEELSSYTKTDENRMKALITAQTDSFVPKFANKRVDHPRRTVFIATVNPEGDGAYLKGQSGNTRFLPLAVRDIDIQGFLAKRTELFAEAKAYHLTHREDWWQLECEVDATNEREERRQTSVYEGEPLRQWLSLRRPAECTWQEVADLHLQIPKDRWNKALQMEIGKALRAHKWLPQRTESRRYWAPG